MKKKQSDRGSIVEIAIIVGLVVVVLGLTAWRIIEGNAAINNSKSESQAQESVKVPDIAATSVKLVQGSIDPGFGTKLTFSYPETWKKEALIEGPMPLNETKGNTTETITLISPSKKYVVGYMIGANGGLGGACIPEEQPVYTWSSYEGLSGFSGVSYLEATTSPSTRSDGNVRSGWQLSLVETTAAKKATPRTSVCELYMANVIELSSQHNVQIIGAGMKSITGVDDADTFKAALSGDEYEQAKAILLSTSH